MILHSQSNLRGCKSWGESNGVFEPHSSHSNHLISLYCSKNSIDENAIDANKDVNHLALEPNNHYDEQEMSLEMYNDEFDHFNKLPASGIIDNDLYLDAALKQRTYHKKNNPQNNMNKQNVTSKNAPMSNIQNPLAIDLLRKENNTGLDKNIYTVSNDLNYVPPHNVSTPAPLHNASGDYSYDNGAFMGDSDPYVTRTVSGLKTTDI